MDSLQIYVYLYHILNRNLFFCHSNTGMYASIVTRNLENTIAKSVIYGWQGMKSRIIVLIVDSAVLGGVIILSTV